MKGADHVLSERVIDCRFAPDRRIHLGEERGGYLNVLHAPLIGSGREAREIADYAAAQSN
jgi:hypothetical protein